MTLDQIAKSMVTSQAALQDQSYPCRREFYASAFAAGHDVDQIAKYVNRRTISVRHGLRVHCMETFGGPYDRSVEEMRDAMGRVGA